MSMKKRLTLILAVLSAAAFTAAAGDVDSLWTRAVEDYTDGRYEAALEGFTSIEEQGFVSADLFYNIGNCYYRLDHYLGKAILYYERALKYDPSYEDAAVNLGIARQYTLDRIDSVPEFILLTWIKALRDAVPSDGWAWTAAALLLLTSSPESITTISEKLGFASVEYFSSSFFMKSPITLGIDFSMGDCIL